MFSLASAFSILENMFLCRNNVYVSWNRDQSFLCRYAVILFVIISLIGYSFSPLTLTYSTKNKIFLFLIIKINVSSNGSCAIVVCTCRTSVRRGSKYGVRNVLVCFIYTQFLFLLLFLLKPIMHSSERPITPPLYPLSSVSQQNTFFFQKNDVVFLVLM